MDQGLDAPKAPRVRSGVGAMRHHQRQSMAVRSSGGMSGRGGGGGAAAVVAPSTVSGAGKQVGRGSEMLISFCVPFLCEVYPHHTRHFISDLTVTISSRVTRP